MGDYVVSIDPRHLDVSPSSRGQNAPISSASCQVYFQLLIDQLRQILLGRSAQHLEQSIVGTMRVFIYTC
jgi:hypothetical protein